jgi:uroporphyrinogen decarboxylase
MRNPLFDAIYFNNNGYTPIWLMRQAGRYLPEYRQLRAKAGSFLSLCKNVELATAVTLQPLQRFSLDAAIMFSDILVVPEAMGLELDFIANEGPVFKQRITNLNDVVKLDNSQIEVKLDYVFQLIKSCKQQLKANIPLIGFSGSPFTLACYMLEGRSSKDYLEVKRWVYSNSMALEQLLLKLSDAIITYLKKQVDAGVDALMLFDSWGGVLTPSAYQEYSLKYINKIVSALKQYTLGKNLPLIVFTKGGSNWLQQIAQIQPDVIGLDWTIDIGVARKIITNKIALQGNLDPMILAVGDRASLKREAMQIIDNYKLANNGDISGLVFNLGHGININTKPDNVAYLVDFIHEYSKQ